MRPTRRGYAALTVVAILILMGVTAGSRGRALNAVAAPVLVAVVAGALQVRRSGKPRVERTEPQSGFPGETRTVELTVDGGGVAAIIDGVGDGLSGSATFERSLPTTVSYEVTYDRRGVHTLGTTSVRVRDVLGLVEATHEVAETTAVNVYPYVYSVGDTASVLRTLGPESTERSEFDHLREYVSGDSLRDINWKSSAKHDDLLVTEFTDQMGEAAVDIAARCVSGEADEMATAAATLFVAATRADLSVGLTVPEGTLPQGHGEAHERQALELLARTRSGDVPEQAWEAADIQIHTDESGVSITIDERVHTLEDLTATRENPLLTEVAA